MLASRFISNLVDVSSDDEDSDEDNDGNNKDDLDRNSKTDKDEGKRVVKDTGASVEDVDPDFIALSNTLSTSIQQSVAPSIRQRTSIKFSNGTLHIHKTCLYINSIVI